MKPMIMIHILQMQMFQHKQQRSKTCMQLSIYRCASLLTPVRKPLVACYVRRLVLLNTEALGRHTVGYFLIPGQCRQHNAERGTVQYMQTSPTNIVGIWRYACYNNASATDTTYRHVIYLQHNCIVVYQYSYWVTK